MIKKILSIIIALCSAFVFTSCKGENITVYAPDGAPALALTRAINTLDGFDFSIVGSDVIETKVSGKDKVADVCVLPIDSALKFLSSGDSYQMLGALTHGNFYFLGRNEDEINRNNISSLIGKTVGVLQINKIPGLAFKAVLAELQTPYQIVQDKAQSDSQKVNLIAVNKVEVCSEKADIYLIPSPLADAKDNKTDFKFIGSLHGLYAEKSIYQAVIVAKKSVIKNDLVKIKELINSIKGVEEYLLTQEKGIVLQAIESRIEKGLTPTFNEQNYTSNAIKNCFIKFVQAKDCYREINGFIEKVKSVSPSLTGEFSNEFYYGGDL